MTARANIAVGDGESTPVTHTFVPDGNAAPDVVRYVNRTVATPAAAEVLTLGWKRSTALPEDFSTPGKKVSPRTTEIRLRYPATYVDSTTGLTLVDFVDEAKLTFMGHPRSSDQRMKNLRTMMVNALATSITQISNAIDKGEPVW